MLNSQEVILNAKRALRDEDVFSREQIRLLEQMLDEIETAIDLSIQERQPFPKDARDG